MGRYISEVEQEALDYALNLFSTAGAALEVGCEGGRWTEIVVGRGWQLTGTEVDPKTLALCQKRYPSTKCILVRPEDRTLPCEANSVDLLLCVEVVPVAQSDWFSAEVARVLRPGGVLFATMLNRMSLRSAFVLLRLASPWRPPFSDVGFLYRISYGKFKAEYQKLGLEFLYERGFCWAPFSRGGDSVVIPFCNAIERGLGLQRLPSLSPWVVFVARKRRA